MNFTSFGYKIVTTAEFKKNEFFVSAFSEILAYNM